jgi:hypothetical protein
MGAHVSVRGMHGGIYGLSSIRRTGIGHQLVLGKSAQGIEQALLVFTACEGDHKQHPSMGFAN